MIESIPAECSDGNVVASSPNVSGRDALVCGTKEEEEEEGRSQSSDTVASKTKA